MSGYLPKHDPGAAITLTATEDLTAGRLVTGAAATADADATNVVGVAARTVTTGEAVTVYGGGVQNLTAAGALAAGALVKAAADGKVAAHVVGTDAPERLVGVTLATAAAADDIVPVKFLR